MGWAARANPNTDPVVQRALDTDRELRTLMALFPDRETFDAWADARGVSPEQRAHMVTRAPWVALDDEKDGIGG